MDGHNDFNQSADLEKVHGPDALLGTVLDDRFEICEFIGAGGTSWVFRGRHRELEEDVAIKVLLQKADADNSHKRFLNEARLVNSLHHPNLVRVTSFGITGSGMPYMVMELVKGRPLSQILKERGALPPSEAVSYLCQICSGLSAAHNNGITHRDLKPGNVMLTDDGQVKILDFGIARTDDSSDQKLTSTGTLLGSPQYMSPEQCLGKMVDQRSDIYSLGCIAYELLRGTPVFTGESELVIMSHHVSTAPPSLPDERSLRALNDVILKCLAKEPERRFNDADSLLAALKSIDLDSLTTAVSPTGATSFHKRLIPAVIATGLVAGGWYFASDVMRKSSQTRDESVQDEFLARTQLDKKHLEKRYRKDGDAGTKAVRRWIEYSKHRPERSYAVYQAYSILCSDYGGGAESTRQMEDFYKQCESAGLTNYGEWRRDRRVICFLRGTCLRNLGSYDQEMKMYEEALRLSGKAEESQLHKSQVIRDYQIYRAMADCAIKMKDYAGGARWLEKAIASCNKGSLEYADNETQAGSVEAKQGNLKAALSHFDEARDSLDQAVSLTEVDDHDFANLNESLAHHYYLIGQYARAYESMSKAIAYRRARASSDLHSKAYISDVKGNADIMVKLGKAAELGEYFKRELPYLKVAARDTAGYLSVLEFITWILDVNSCTRDSELFLQELEKLDLPDYLEVKKRAIRATHFRVLGNYDLSESEILKGMKCLEANPNPDQELGLILQLVHTYRFQKRYDEIFALYEKAKKQFSNKKFDGSMIHLEFHVVAAKRESGRTADLMPLIDSALKRAIALKSSGSIIGLLQEKAIELKNHGRRDESIFVIDGTMKTLDADDPDYLRNREKLTLLKMSVLLGAGREKEARALVEGILEPLRKFSAAGKDSASLQSSLIQVLEIAMACEKVDFAKPYIDELLRLVNGAGITDEQKLFAYMSIIPLELKGKSSDAGKYIAVAEPIAVKLGRTRAMEALKAYRDNL